MIPLTVKEIVDSVNGKLLYGLPDFKVNGVSIDSRAVSPGDLFIPLRGKNDGHAYIADAIRGGASGFLIESRVVRKDKFSAPGGTLFTIEVEDGLRALQAIAVHHRKKLSAKVIGVTGSTGKTTTKDMLSCILSRKMQVISTAKNHNNEIGVPLTILRAGQSTSALIIEMAMRGLGQIKELAEIAVPDIGVVTNIGQAHIELLGCEETIARAKSELIEAIPPDGVVVLNADDIWTPNIIESTRAKIFTYGITNGDVRGSEIEIDELGRAFFRLTIGNYLGHVVRLAVPGRHNVYNALAATAVAIKMGIRVDDIRIALAECRPSAMRMEVFSTDDNVLILNDAYNANPTSMHAALSTLMDVETKGRRIAVLGDMLELGRISSEAHMQIGEVVASLGVNILIAVGKESQLIAESAVRAGMSTKAVITCPDSDTAAKLLKQLAMHGDVVLVKASRGIGLEAVVEALVKT
ncbi:MAG: UDP-N-acetylmuramoyl-tripeptide--D-alanyl-D-alanine ligase [Actinobacteria bacterium]|nr:UDP-N-acetylmuramoyl-tripeptide--D-alanyl-D-alanine ligase [Actinomycetota bacterium]